MIKKVLIENSSLLETPKYRILPGGLYFQDIEVKYSGSPVKKQTLPLLVITEDIPNDLPMHDQHRKIEHGLLGEDLMSDNDSD